MATLPASAISVFHFDGDLNDSLENATLTNNGVVTSNAQSKFGSNSGYFNHTISAYLTGTVSSSDIRTVAMWIYFTAYTDTYYPTPFCVGPNTDGWRGIYIHADPYGASTYPVYAVGNNSDSGWTQLSGSSSMMLNVWNHIAFTKEGTSTFRFFINGVLQKTITNADPVISNKITIGGHYLTGVGNTFNGYIDEVIIATTPLWTANFTPPNSAYETPIYDKKNFFHGQYKQMFGGV